MSNVQFRSSPQLSKTSPHRSSYIYQPSRVRSGRSAPTSPQSLFQRWEIPLDLAVLDILRLEDVVDILVSNEVRPVRLARFVPCHPLLARLCRVMVDADGPRFLVRFRSADTLAVFVERAVLRVEVVRITAASGVLIHPHKTLDVAVEKGFLDRPPDKPLKNERVFPLLPIAGSETHPINADRAPVLRERGHRLRECGVLGRP